MGYSSTENIYDNAKTYTVDKFHPYRQEFSVNFISSYQKVVLWK